MKRLISIISIIFFLYAGMVFYGCGGGEEGQGVMVATGDKNGKVTDEEEEEKEELKFSCASSDIEIGPKCTSYFNYIIDHCIDTSLSEKKQKQAFEPTFR